MIAPTPPPLQVLGPALLLRGHALQDAYYCVQKGIAAARLAGYDTARLVELLNAIREAHLSFSRQADEGQRQRDSEAHADIASLGGHDGDDLIDIACAADILGCHPRTAQRLAPKLAGRKRGGSWVLSRSLVMAHKEFQESETRHAA